MKQQLKNEIGRSMIEMLGVLGIIGVLSVSGLAGYKHAMALHQANKISTELDLLRVSVLSRADDLTTEDTLDSISFQPSISNPLELLIDEDTYDISVKDVPQDVCDILLKRYDNVSVSGQSENNLCQESNTLIFSYDFSEQADQPAECPGNWSGENCDECHLSCSGYGFLVSEDCVCGCAYSGVDEFCNPKTCGDGQFRYLGDGLTFYCKSCPTGFKVNGSGSGCDVDTSLQSQCGSEWYSCGPGCAGTCTAAGGVLYSFDSATGSGDYTFSRVSGYNYTCANGSCRCQEGSMNNGTAAGGGGFYYMWCSCLAKGTLITLANGQCKKIEDITYQDDLMVWNFDDGCFDVAKPLWIKIPQQTDSYNLLKFNDGSVLKTINQHRIFNKELGKFTYPMSDETPIGTTTFNCLGKEVKLVSKEIIHEPVQFYNIITIRHINCFANGILTSCRLNNLYPIKDMKFIKDNRKLADQSCYADVSQEWFVGARLSEQPQDLNRENDDNSHGKTWSEYIQHCLELAQPK